MADKTDLILELLDRTARIQEQLKHIREDQAQQDKDVKSLQSDMSEVKKDIAIIKQDPVMVIVKRVVFVVITAAASFAVTSYLKK